MIDRSSLNQALAKALAYKDVGKDIEADRWARLLVQMLKDLNVIKN
jgi:hypothetical protein